MNCRNGEKYLKESLVSVLNQTYLNWELVFVDNKSDDQSKNIFFQHKDKRLKYFSTNTHLNLGAARQFALDRCNGEFIAFLDTDDLWEKQKLEDQIKYFLDPQVGMVISNTIFFSDQKKKIFYKKKPPTGFVLNELLKKYFISLETLICRKFFIDKILFKFDEQFTMISDLDLALRLAKVSKLEYCPNILAKWRIHENSETWIKTDKF
ncbi:glycosyltransferase, partial [Candidatus Pelagibacter sp.]|nr:glycosyltransferase [Candidatus Pelagibacter sp.]